MGPLHEKYGLSKTREAEDMCNYSEYLKQKQETKDMLKMLARMETRQRGNTSTRSDSARRA